LFKKVLFLAVTAANSEVLKQFHQHGLSINEGDAIDAKNGFILSTTLSPASRF